MNQNFRAIELFAGIGGIRLGFEQAFKDKIKFVYANEIDPYACITYEENFGENPEGDITKINPKELPNFDILLAGFPCQAFSIAGKKRGFNDIRGTLFFNLAEILKIKQPDAFLLENVKHLINHDKGRTFQVIKDVLSKDLNYNIHAKILNAKDFGVPQNRERIFIVGFKKNLAFKFPEPLNIPVKIEDILEKGVETSYYLSHEYLSGLKNHRARHEKKGNGFGYEVRPRIGIANAIVCGGMGKERNLVRDKILPDCWKKEGDDIQLRNEEGVRKMTPREWARLQGYPDSFKFPVSMTKAYKQLGNSVAVPVIKSIALEMKKALLNPIIEKKYEISEELEQIIILMEKFYEKKEIPKTGKKFITSIQTFINKNYLRIDDLDHLVTKMELFKIVSRINKTQIQISKKLLNISDKGKFLNTIMKLLNSTNHEITLDKFIDTSIQPKI
ncbi:MAG: DNA cytosine methyltransferase [Promethearchaeota archaeon]